MSVFQSCNADETTKILYTFNWDSLWTKFSFQSSEFPIFEKTFLLLNLCPLSLCMKYYIPNIWTYLLCGCIIILHMIEGKGKVQLKLIHAMQMHLLLAENYEAFTVLIFWIVTTCSVVVGSMDLWNIGVLSQHYAAS